jgi:hypothetical protein
MNKIDSKTVLVTFCVDTEGPLYESLHAKFERLEELYGLKGIPHTKDNLQKLIKGEIDLNGIEKEIKAMLEGYLAGYNENWQQLDQMLDCALSYEFRNEMLDSYGGSWVYSWFIMDHVYYNINPRKRDIGFHNIFDFYSEKFLQFDDCDDEIQFHFHPMSINNEAHRCATSYFSRSSVLYEILCRRILDRNWFPSAYRAGFQAERPDSNWFLEQWIPFDISNMALDDNSELNKTIDFKDGRSGDWRLAPSDWRVYKPDQDYYQLEGSSRRYIGRALNVLNRVASINQYEVEKAFKRADTGTPTLMGMAVHDFRYIPTAVKHVRSLISDVSKKYSDVKFKYCNVKEAFRYAVWGDSYADEFEISITYIPASKHEVASIRIEVIKGKVFGPQPFLAVETIDGRYFHDNVNFSECLTKWYYAFYSDTIDILNVKKIGVAANDMYGNTSVKVIDFNLLKDYDKSITI